MSTWYVIFFPQKKNNFLFFFQSFVKNFSQKMSYLGNPTPPERIHLPSFCRAVLETKPGRSFFLRSGHVTFKTRLEQKKYPDYIDFCTQKRKKKSIGRAKKRRQWKKKQQEKNTGHSDDFHLADICIRKGEKEYKKRLNSIQGMVSLVPIFC